jgi:hypothetical protein
MLKDARRMIAKVRATADRIDAAQPDASSASTSTHPSADETEPMFGREDALRAVSRIASHIERHLVEERDAPPHRLIPGDYRQFSTNPMSVAYGAAGACRFLHETRGELPAELERRYRKMLDELDPDHYPAGLMVGLAGIAWTAWRLGFRDAAKRLMREVYRKDDRTEAPDYFYGAAGWGMASLFFHRETGEQRYLDRAMEALQAIESHAVAKEFDGQHLPGIRNVDGKIYHGMGHGAAGVSMFLAELSETTGHQPFAGAAHSFIEFELAHARRKSGELTWPRFAGDKAIFPYLRIGAAGIGLALIRNHEISHGEAADNARYLEAAELAAENLAGIYAIFPGLYSGMAGLVAFLDALARASGDAKRRRQAFAAAERMMAFGAETEHGLAFPGEELIRRSNDFATGSAGVGTVLAMLAQSPADKTALPFTRAKEPARLPVETIG